MGSHFCASTRWSIAFLLLLTLTLNGGAQTATPVPATTPPQATPATADDVKEALVFESSHTKITYQEDGSDVREVTAVIKVLSQAGVQGLAVLPFSYTSANETVEFDYVRVRKPDGTLVVTPDYNIQDMPADVSRSAPMYSDVHEKHVTVKAVSVGDTLEYLVRYRTTKPQVPGQFWFAYTFRRDVICKDDQLVIDVPRDKAVKISSPDVKPQTVDQGDRRIYTWKTANLERKDESKTRSPLQQPSAPTPSVQITTFRNWEEVGHWYGELARSQVVVTPQIQAKAAELSKGLSSDDDKIRALYDFVSTHYHYVSLSFGIGRYQPHPAEDVFENEYGDCKDKHTLLAALLKAAGYDAWPALINASYMNINSEAPSPGQFDHVITVVPRNGNLLWLDTTPGVTPFGMLMVNLRHKQALVMPSDKPAMLIYTPENPPFPSEQTFTATGKLDADGTFTAHVKATALGDTGAIERYIFQQYPTAQWKDVLQQTSYRWGFAGDVSAVDVVDVSDINKPLLITYDYKREKFGDWENRRISAPLPPIGLEGTGDSKGPEQPIFLGATGSIEYKAQIELPSGYTPTLPAKLELNEDFADFQATYQTKNGTFTVTRTLTIKKPEVAITAWASYQKFAKAISDDHESWITLNEAGKPGISKPSSDAQAEQLFDEGLTALRNHDLTRSEDLYTQLIKIDPNYAYAHSNLGSVYLGEGRIADGIKELRKEEELHPNETYSYRTLGWALQNQHDTAGAIEQYQKLLNLDPKDRDAAMGLAQVLEGEKRYPDSVTVLEKAIAYAPDSIPLQSYLGFAYIRNGENDKGLVLLQKVTDAKIDSMRSAAELNGLAYTLTELNVGLDLAMKSAAKSLQIQETASLKNSGDEGLRDSYLLGATWDTLGWIYFEQNQYEKALPYLRASWLLTQNPEVGDHLGQLYAKLGKKQEAAHTYQLAYFAMNRNTPFTEGKAILGKIKQHDQELMGANANIGANDTHRSADGSYSPMAVEELSRMREVKITSAPHPSAHGTFEIILSAGKVEDVTQIDGDESLKSLIEKMKEAKYSVEFPDTSRVKIVRRGIVSCGSRGCDLVLLESESRSLTPTE